MAETEIVESESQIQEKTITSQTEDLKKISENADGNEVDIPMNNGVENHVEEEEKSVQASDSVVVEEKPISESNEADCGNSEAETPTSQGNEAEMLDEKPTVTETNEADSGIEEEKTITEGNEADSGKTITEGTEADSGTASKSSNSESNEADSGTTKEPVNESSESQDNDNSTKSEGVSSTEAVSSEKTSTEESKANGSLEKKEDKAEKKDHPLGSSVAKHYNEIPAGTKELRKESRIYHLRNFNNWIKSVIISEYLEKIKRRKRVSDDINILDLACGKGGDLLKWQKGKVDHLIMADIASTSIDQCKERYAKLQKDQRNNRYYRDRLFTAEFFAADCTKEKLNEHYRRKDIKLDLSSCQFAFHYSFESYEQADMMLKNLCENLRVGGYFIGTTPDAHKLVKHIKACKADSFGNSVFNIKPENKETFPLFGSKYMFYLEGVVDCPEFIVYLPLLEKMAAKYNMKLVWKKNFHDIFKDFERQHASLLAKMSALEQYPAAADKQLAGGSESQYKSAKDYVDKKGNKRVGTLSADEWEVAGLYIAFAFEKMAPPEEAKPKEKDRDRDDRKRTRDDSRSSSGHSHGTHAHSHSSHSDKHRDKRDSSSSAKKAKKEAETEEVYEIKDEIYEDETEKTDTKLEEKTDTKREEKTDTKREEKTDTKREEKSDTKREEKTDTKREEKSHRSSEKSSSDRTSSDKSKSRNRDKDRSSSSRRKSDVKSKDKTKATTVDDAAADTSMDATESEVAETVTEKEESSESQSTVESSGEAEEKSGTAVEEGASDAEELPTAPAESSEDTVEPAAEDSETVEPAEDSETVEPTEDSETAAATTEISETAPTTDTPETEPTEKEEEPMEE